MTSQSLATFYRGYIACLNGQDFTERGRFVGDSVAHNGGRIGLSG
jgi:predicted ester cyclase